MPQLQVVEVIALPRRAVWEVISNPLLALEWVSAAEERRFAARQVLEKGTVTRHVDRFLGRHVNSTWEIVEYEPPGSLVARTIVAPIAMEYAYELTGLPGGTRVSLTVHAESGLGGLFGRMADSVVIGMVRRNLQADLTNLKELLEAGELGPIED
ncbi:MAG: hypothetical protein HKN80_13545 [Acidimicrobiia bacterium]|nr:hypothetical protein [Acidimicrobiia bacterium]